MNAFVRSNLAVALLRLREAEAKLVLLAPARTDEEKTRHWESIGAIEWSVREAQRQIADALTLDDMESVDTLPMPAESEVKVTGGMHR